MSTRFATGVQILPPPSPLRRRLGRKLHLLFTPSLTFHGGIEQPQTFLHAQSTLLAPARRYDANDLTSWTKLDIVPRFDSILIRNRLGDGDLQLGRDFGDLLTSARK